MSRAVLVTGGTRGIGFATAEALLRAGNKVAITGTTADGIVKAENSLSAIGQAVGIVCDVRDTGAVELAMQTVVARWRGSWPRPTSCPAWCSWMISPTSPPARRST